MRYTRSVPALVLTLLATAACDVTEPTAHSDDTERTERPSTQAAPWSTDEELARIARHEVPGFAGYFLEDDGTPVIRLVDVSRAEAAQRVLGTQLRGATGSRVARGPKPAVVVGAFFDFAQLKDWADALEPMLQRDGIFLIDVDERDNRVMVGVGDAAAMAAVRAEADRIGMPAMALHVRTQPRPEVRASLRDRHNPLKGGIQIAFGSGLCTLGFNATRVSNGQSIFVTNSHCTPTYLGSDGGAIYQNLTASGNLVGYEVADRGLYACAGSGTSCRRADAAYISHNGSRSVSRGLIARTNWATGRNAGTTIVGDFRITGRYTGTLPVGSYLDKTGRTSGSTYGQVTNSCVTIGNFRCQDISKVWSEGGDSGSPVYVWLSGNDVQLHGVMWGGPGTDYTTTYSSRLSGIEQDLGALTNLCVSGC